MYPLKTEAYFKRKARDYDLVDKQSYWVLSDKILWHVLKAEVLECLSKDFEFCDAGGGTGRWSLKILESFLNSKGLTIDASEDMLSEAYKKRNFINKDISERWEILKADLHNLKILSENRYDLTFNLHNVLGFVQEPLQVIKQLARITKKNGYVVSFVPNKFHAAYFNLTLGKINEARKALKGKSRFTDEMPDIHLFSIESITDLLKQANLTVKKTLGFPSLIYPGYQETQIYGQTESILSLLENPQTFEEIYKLELECLQYTTAARGNNLLLIAQKT